MSALPAKTLEQFKAGARYGAWSVISARAPSGREGRALCRCDCGYEGDVRRCLLLSGGSSKCSRCNADAKRTHGMYKSTTYQSWTSMKVRCQKPEHVSFPRYGGRGITVCDRWQTFANFLEDMGERPDGMTLDRIDNDRGYEPGNCRWASLSEQAYNRSGRRSSFRGVCHEVNRHGTTRWVSVITVNGKQKKLGRFDTQEAAAEAFRAAGGQA